MKFNGKTCQDYKNNNSTSLCQLLLQKPRLLKLFELFARSLKLRRFFTVFSKVLMKLSCENLPSLYSISIKLLGRRILKLTAN